MDDDDFRQALEALQQAPADAGVAFSEQALETLHLFGIVLLMSGEHRPRGKRFAPSSISKSHRRLSAAANEFVVAWDALPFAEQLKLWPYPPDQDGTANGVNWEKLIGAIQDHVNWRKVVGEFMQTITRMGMIANTLGLEETTGKSGRRQPIARHEFIMFLGCLYKKETGKEPKASYHPDSGGLSEFGRLVWFTLEALGYEYSQESIPALARPALRHRF